MFEWMINGGGVPHIDAGWSQTGFILPPQPTKDYNNLASRLRVSYNGKRIITLSRSVRVGDVGAYVYTNEVTVYEKDTFGSWLKIYQDVRSNTVTGFGEMVAISGDGSTIAYQVTRNVVGIFRQFGNEWVSIGTINKVSGNQVLTGIYISHDGNRVLWTGAYVGFELHDYIGNGWVKVSIPPMSSMPTGNDEAYGYGTHGDMSTDGNTIALTYSRKHTDKKWNSSKKEYDYTYTWYMCAMIHTQNPNTLAWSSTTVDPNTDNLKRININAFALAQDLETCFWAYSSSTGWKSNKPVKSPATYFQSRLPPQLGIDRELITLSSDLTVSELSDYGRVLSEKSHQCIINDVRYTSFNDASCGENIVVASVNKYDGLTASYAIVIFEKL